jgi:hypothetical protein
VRTLALRGGARVAVVEDEWYDAFGVVIRGRVQLELRDGAPGPVLGRDAAFWLRGTGVRALRNPGPRTARIRVLTPRARTPQAHQHTLHASYRTKENDMNSTHGTEVVARSASGHSHIHRLGRLVATGFIGVLAAVVATTLVAALCRASGVDFEIADGSETIPVSGVGFVTGFFSVVGIVIAVAMLRWSARPAQRFVQTAVSLTVISLVPPFLSGADPSTTAALVGLHLVAATVMIPTLAWSLRTRTD